jgi:ketosteroid isomerase-like protein
VPDADGERVARVRRAFAAITSGDLDAFLAMTTEDVEFTSLIAEAEGAVFRGHRGVRKWWDTVRGEFADVRWDLHEVRLIGDWVVTSFRMSGVLSGVPLEQQMWQAAEERDGMIAWWSIFRTEREALDAIALRR